MDTSFVPLRLRSRYTYFGGTIEAGALPERLRDLGFGAGALVDRDNLYGAVEFYEHALANDIKPVIGADVACGGTGKRASLFALSRRGYGNLCRVISEVRLDGEAKLAVSVGRSPEGLAAISADLDLAVALRDILGEDRVWAEIVINRKVRPSVSEHLARASRAGLRAIATWDVLFDEHHSERTARLLAAVGQGRLLSRVNLDVRDASVEACAGLEGICRTHPELLAETQRLAEMVDLDLELGKPHFPCATASRRESFAKLEKMCLEALRSKYANPQRALGRLQKELRVIGYLGLADYFLVVADVVAFAAGRGIPTSGRGSGASSLVAYLVGITQVDPIEHGLVFERFLNEHRPDYPDLDIDIAWRRRDEVIDYVYGRYGKTKVAMISTRACFELRSAAREVAKAFGLSAYEAQSLAARLPHATREGAGDLIRARLGEIKPESPVEIRRGISEMATSIVGFPHHSSVHCGGIVIADTAITDYTPLEQAAKGIAITQFDMHAAEKVGLVKIDLLGNRALSVIEEATKAVELSRGISVKIQPDDPATARIMRSGQTLSCFQLESPAMRNLLAMLRAGDLRDATLAVALVRPGPSAGGMKEKFIRTRLEGDGGGKAQGRGGEKGEGRGGEGTGNGNGNGSLPVYEEDVMRIIARYTGMSLAEADIVRRELKGGAVNQKDLERRFLFLADTTGVSKAEARKAWEHVHRFAAYTFCKAHACSFGILAYAAAYLKANFPLEFYAATLRNHSGMYPVWAHVNEARRLGIRVLLPSVNRSKADFSVEGDAIRTGLTSIKHMAQKTIDAILAERRQGPFVSLDDFLARVEANRDETGAMIAAGAFDEVEPERSSALAAHMAHKGVPVATRQPQLDLRGATRVALPTRPFTDLQRHEMELEVLGFSPLVHPLSLFNGEGGGSGAKGARQAEVRGLLAAVRHYKAEGRDLYFITLDGPRGLTECILPRDCVSLRLELGRAYTCRGRARKRFGVTTLRAESIGSLRKKTALDY